jgi:hypothetical protein
MRSRGLRGLANPSPKDERDIFGDEGLAGNQTLEVRFTPNPLLRYIDLASDDSQSWCGASRQYLAQWEDAEVSTFHYRSQIISY